MDRWHLLKNLRQSTERILEGNHAALSGIALPAKSGGSGEKDALMGHTPAPRSSKEQAASTASRAKLLARYRKVKKLHAQGMSMMAICRALGMSRGAVRRYVHADSFRSVAAIRRKGACSTPLSRTSRNAGRRAATWRCGCGGR